MYTILMINTSEHALHIPLTCIYPLALAYLQKSFVNSSEFPTISLTEKDIIVNAQDVSITLLTLLLSYDNSLPLKNKS